MTCNQTNHEEFAVVVVGAGPAGLAAANYCAQAGLKVLVIENGKTLPERQHDSPTDIVSGVGGAGLYSDGKFSFFPSATKLWKLADTLALKKSYSWLVDILEASGLTVPPFPSLNENGKTEKSRRIYEKEYPSFYLSFLERKNLILHLTKHVQGSIHAGSRLIRLVSVQHAVHVEYTTKEGARCCLAKTVILAGGRFGALDLKTIAPEITSTFRRYEVGLRIEQSADTFALGSHTALDPKVILHSGEAGVEWRTFCTCRHGEIVTTDWSGLKTLSGRADGKHTDSSSVGFNLRITDRAVSQNIVDEIESVLNRSLAPFRVEARAFLNDNLTLFGPNIDNLLRKGLEQLSKHASLEGAFLSGPCVEGTGFYPDINDNLKIPMGPIWVAGDMSGLFRGITAAMLSGHYVAQKVVEFLSKIDDWNIPVKQSSTAQMAVVFTAQSKVHFYCRDAVCEYVLKQNKLALNPFRVFEYFLGDRVERDVVRQGNNQLIRISDELWVFGPIADGVLFEIVLARQLGKPVRFFTIGTRSSEIHPISINEIVFESAVHAKRTTRQDLVAFLSGDPSLGTAEAPKQSLFDFV